MVEELTEHARRVDPRRGSLILDQELVSRFEWLRYGKPPPVATPPIFMAFDCLYAADSDRRALALNTRRDRLEAVIQGQDLVLSARGLASHGLGAWDQAVTRGYEGLVAKDPAAPYVGGVTLTWLKVKQLQYRSGERGWEPTR